MGEPERVSVDLALPRVLHPSSAQPERDPGPNASASGTPTDEKVRLYLETPSSHTLDQQKQDKLQGEQEQEQEQEQEGEARLPFSLALGSVAVRNGRIALQVHGEACPRWLEHINGRVLLADNYRC